MKLIAVETIDVRGLPNAVYSFAKAPDVAHDRVLVTGGPGSGKTRLLETIATARRLFVPDEDLGSMSAFVRRGNRFSKAILSWLLTPKEQATIGAVRPVVPTEVIFGADVAVEGLDPRFAFLLERYDHDDATPKLEYFSEQRRLEFGGGEMPLDESTQKPLRARGDARKFAWLPGFLEALPRMPDEAARFAATLERFSATAAYDLGRHVLSSRGRPLRGLGELSASEADGVTFAATAALVGLSSSIVLVDRPEVNGLDARHAFDGLSALGVDNQLIMTTSSVEMLAGFDGALIQLDALTGSRG